MGEAERTVPRFGPDIEQLQQNSRRYLDLDKPLHQTVQLSEIFADWADRLMDDAGASEVGKGSIELSENNARQIDFAFRYLMGKLRELEDIHRSGA